MFPIVHLTPAQVTELLYLTSIAENEGKSVRLQTGEDANGTWVKWDIGNTGWTPPLYGEDY